MKSPLFIDANTPYELIPNQPIKYGVLLVHGLFDCPFSLREIGENLYANGILVKSILLPGHGTVPEDLLNITYHDWIKATHDGIESLKSRAEKIIVVGFSTGATLALHEAFQHQSLAAMVLLAPAIKLHPLVDVFMKSKRLRFWLRKNKRWAIIAEENNYAKYQSVPFNAVSQLVSLTQLIAKLHEKKSVTCPVFMCLSEQDQTISARSAIAFFSSLTQANNQLLLYSSHKNHQKYDYDSRIKLRTACFPNLNITGFSHLCLPFSINNHHYGLQGDYQKDTSHTMFGAYNLLVIQFQTFLYDLGLAEYKKAELTFNPDFDFMNAEITKFILGVN